MSESKPERGRYDKQALELAEPPADVPEDAATGHAVYDRVKRQFVGPVHRDSKPSNKDAEQLVGHTHYAVVRV